MDTVGKFAEETNIEAETELLYPIKLDTVTTKEYVSPLFNRLDRIVTTPVDWTERVLKTEDTCEDCGESKVNKYNSGLPPEP